MYLSGIDSHSREIILNRVFVLSANFFFFYSFSLVESQSLARNSHSQDAGQL